MRTSTTLVVIYTSPNHNPISEMHASLAADIDGDGVPDYVTGKRYLSHLESYTDADPYGASVLYWFRTMRNPKAPGGAEFVPQLIHNRFRNFYMPHRSDMFIGFRTCALRD